MLSLSWWSQDGMGQAVVCHANHLAHFRTLRNFWILQWPWQGGILENRAMGGGYQAVEKLEMGLPFSLWLDCHSYYYNLYFIIL